jgi:hypothetical protein
MTREPAESCGKNWARCGKPMAIGGVLRLAAHRSARKTVSMEVVERCSASNHRASAEIRTAVQSLATHARATRRTRDASFETKSDTAEST